MSAAHDGLILHLNRDELHELTIRSLTRPLNRLGQAPFTVCGWIRISDPDPIQVIANQGHYSSVEPGWSIYVREGSLVAGVLERGVHLAREIPLADANPWHHFAVVFDGVNPSVNLFCDGSQQGEKESKQCLEPHGPPARQDGLLIGGYTDKAGGHFNYTFGRRSMDKLDDLRIYNRTLTPADIAAFIDSANRRPFAAFTIKEPDRHTPTKWEFDASESEDDDGQIAAYWWDLGDGSKAEGQKIEHSYRYGGSYQVQLTVLDDDHAQSTAEETIEVVGAPTPVVFTPVFENGDEDYAGFRIPSIIDAANGDLLAFAEGRVESISDSTRTIRIVCKRSGDNGQTWGPLQVAGRSFEGGEEYAAMYPAPAVDRVMGTARVILVYKQMACSEWELAQGKGKSSVACVYSDDHGLTWRGESDITGQVHRPDEWRIQIPTAGHAIQLSGLGGRDDLCGWLFFVGGHTVDDDTVFEQRNYAFWSKDLGSTWQIGPDIKRRVDSTSAKGLNEAIAVELSDGRVMVNSRNYRGQQPVGYRAVTTGEFDETGNLRFGSAYEDQMLVEPAVQASMLRYRMPDDEFRQGILLFSNPAHPSSRRNLTVRASLDDGQTWPFSRVIDEGPSSYSDLVKQKDGQIGVLYERGNDGGIYYGRFSLDWLLGRDKGPI